MRYTDMLRQDHEDIQTVLAILAELSNRLEEDNDVPIDDLATVLRYLDVFVTQSHTAKEEDVLYPALAQVGLPPDSGPIALMMAEHQMVQNFLVGLHDAVARYRPGDTDDGHMIAEYARNYALLFSKHIEQEDAVIYPVSEERLPKPAQEEIAKRFEQIEHDTIGEHDSWHAMAHSLAESYLN